MLLTFLFGPIHIYIPIYIYIFSTSRYLDGKEKPKKTNDKAYNKTKRKEKTRESEKRSYKKEM